MDTLKKIEKDLEQILKVDKTSWTQFYLKLKMIEEEHLYLEAGCRSFTSWVKEFAIKTKTHESVIWNRKKAGKVYEQYIKTKEAEGITVKPLANITVAADSLVLLDKITSKNEAVGAELVEKVMEKEITREDLRNAYKVVRGDLGKNTLGDNRIKNKNLDKKNEEEISEENKEETIVATDIVTALSNSNWLLDRKKSHLTGCFRSAFQQEKYKAILEFPVYPGTSRKSRRIDMLILENLTVEHLNNLQLHGIEIKISKDDLNKDQKYTEYMEFVDYMWLAIPKKLQEFAETVVPTTVGILTLKEDREIVVSRNAVKLNSGRIDESLRTATMRLIKA